MKDKDITQKQLEDYNDVFADIMNVLLFQGKRMVSEEDLVPANNKSQFKDTVGKIHEQERDIAKYWEKGGVRFALCGLENQTAIDTTMSLRVIGYDGAAYKSELLNKEEHFYPVVTVVLYFGTEHWRTRKSLLECFEVPEELAPYVNNYKVNVFEISYLTDEQIQMFTSDFKIVAEFFTGKRKNPDYVPDSTEKINHVDEVLKLLSAVTRDEQYMEILNESERKVTSMCEVAERLVNKGRAEGEIKGEIKAYWKMGKTISEIAEEMNLSESEIQKLLDEIL